MPRLAHPWTTALLVYLACACVATLVGCSPRVAGSDAALGTDVAGEDTGDQGYADLDGVQDAADGEEVADLAELIDMADELDGTDGGEEADAGDGAGGADGADGDDGADGGDGVDGGDGADGGDAADAVLPADCSSTQLPAPLTGTVEFDCKPKIYNKVVMGCGKGPPQPVACSTAGCDCPPPYACYCDGQCGWLRAPDLVKPQHSGQAVWTGKWVVSLAQPYDLEGYTGFEPCALAEVGQGYHVQRWQPGAGKGFELVPMAGVKLYYGKPVALLWGDKVVIATQRTNCEWNQTTVVSEGYSAKAPIYLYDPENNSFMPIAMPKCLKLVVAGGTLVCYERYSGSPGSPQFDPGKLYVLDPVKMAWTIAPPPSMLTAKGWKFLAIDTIAGVGDNVYIYAGLDGGEAPWADGSVSGFGLPLHLVKYSVPSQLWTDFGAVIPWEWITVDHVAVDNVGVVAVRSTGLDAGRFRLDSLKWETSKKFDYSIPGQQEPVLTPCGLFIGSGTWGSAPMLGGWKYRPIQLTNDLKWQLLSPWGYPDEATTARKNPNFLITDKEVLILGGFNGPPDGAFVYHQDSYRLPLTSLCAGGVP